MALEPHGQRPARPSGRGQRIGRPGAYLATSQTPKCNAFKGWIPDPDIRRLCAPDEVAWDDALTRRGPEVQGILSGLARAPGYLAGQILTLIWRAGDSPRERAELALAEIKRLRAFDRKLRIVVSTTGMGAMDPSAMDPVEFMHNGDIATVAVPYFSLESPLALILATTAGLKQATALQVLVHGYWNPCCFKPDQESALRQH